MPIQPKYFFVPQIDEHIKLQSAMKSYKNTYGLCTNNNVKYLALVLFDYMANAIYFYDIPVNNINWFYPDHTVV